MKYWVKVNYKEQLAKNGKNYLYFEDWIKTRQFNPQLAKYVCDKHTFQILFIQPFFIFRQILLECSTSKRRVLPNDFVHFIHPVDVCHY